MLYGVLTYRDQHLGDVRYHVYMRDSFDSTQLHFNNQSISDFDNHVKASDTFDKLSYDNGEWGNPYSTEQTQEERRLDLSKTNRCRTNITNPELISRVGAALRYMQIMGRKNYNQFFSEDDYSGFKSERYVEVEDKGFVRYEYGLIKELKIEMPYVSVHFQEVEITSGLEGLFKKLEKKDKFGNIKSYTPITQKGFSLSTELLGFTYVEKAKQEAANMFGVFETIEDVIDNNPDKNTAWVLDRKYVIVTDEILQEVLKKFYDYNGYIAFDTETTGLKITFKSRTGEADELVGVVLSMEKGTGYYFPLQHKLFKNLCNGDHWYFMERYMKKLLETKKIICHNLQYDWKVAYIYDIVVNCVYDTMVAFSVTKRYEIINFSASLKSLAKEFLGLDMFDLSDFVRSGDFKTSGITFADLPYELVRRYAPADADMTLALFELIEKAKMLQQYEAERIFKLEVGFARAVAYSEFWGHHIAIQRIPEMREGIENNMAKYYDKMRDEVGYDFKPSAPIQVASIAYDEEGLNIPMLTPEKSVKKDIIKPLVEAENPDGTPRYPFLYNYSKWKENETLFKTFLKKLNLYTTQDGYIFSGVSQFGADTGRTSAKDTNYQSYNDTVKKNVQPRPGFRMFDSDFSQIEYRVLASMAGQTNLIHEFEDPDMDYHTFQASRMFGVPYSLVTKALRSQSKGVNFGLPYGMGDSSLGMRIYGDRTKENTRKAGELRKLFFEGQERIEAFFERVRSEGVSKGYTSTYFGRRRYYHRDVHNEGDIRRQAGNHVIQGTAADIYKYAIVRMFNRIIDEGWLGKVLINVFVHDEVLMEVHESIDMRYFMKAWREEFQLEIDGFCKLYAGAGWGSSWYEAKKKDYPPQYISEIIDDYDANPDREWDGDQDQYIKDVDAGYEAYKIQRVLDFIQAPENQGEIVKPLINSLVVERVGDVLKEVTASHNSEERLGEINALLSTPMVLEKGKYKIEKFSDLLSVFCYAHGVDRGKINILGPEEHKVVEEPKAGAKPQILQVEDYEITVDDYLDLRGYHLDVEERVLYLDMRDISIGGVPTNTLTHFVNRKMFANSGTYNVHTRMKDANGAYLHQKTMAYVDNNSYKHIRSFYTQVFPPGLVKV